MKGKLWLLQAFSGLLLLVLLGLHLLGNHTETGLLDYSSVLQRMKDPTFVALETGLLLAVTFHALNGLRGVLLDYFGGPRAERLTLRALSALGLAAVGYGVWLNTMLYLR